VNKQNDQNMDRQVVPTIEDNLKWLRDERPGYRISTDLSIHEMDGRCKLYFAVVKAVIFNEHGLVETSAHSKRYEKYAVDQGAGLAYGQDPDTSYLGWAETAAISRAIGFLRRGEVTIYSQEDWDEVVSREMQQLRNTLINQGERNARLFIEQKEEPKLKRSLNTYFEKLLSDAITRQGKSGVNSGKKSNPYA